MMSLPLAVVCPAEPEVPYDYSLVARNIHGCSEIYQSDIFFTKEGSTLTDIAVWEVT